MSTSPQQQAKKIVSEFQISEEHFFAKTGVVALSLNLNTERNEVNRLMNILDVFNKLQAWFDTPPESWEWYTEQKIASFGNLTAADIVVQNPENGLIALNSYIDSKNLGGFE